MRRHRGVRVWFKPWKTRCACGCAWFPCPDAVTVERPPVARSLHIEDPRWNGPTAYLPPVRPAPAPARRNQQSLMTKGQQWRSQQRR